MALRSVGPKKSRIANGLIAGPCRTSFLARHHEVSGREALLDAALVAVASCPVEQVDQRVAPEPAPRLQPAAGSVLDVARLGDPASGEPPAA